MSGLNQPPPPARLPRGYRERKLAMVCVRPGCAAAPLEDSDYCEPHRADARARGKRSVRLRYRARRAAGLCARCPRSSTRYLCPLCAVRLGRTPKREIDKRIDNSRDLFSADYDGRVRFRGQGRRGRVTHASLDAQDGADATRSLKRLLDGLVYAASPEVQELPRIQREEVLRAALAHGDMLIGIVLEVQERRGYRTERLTSSLSPAPRAERKR